jgi:hypothetical protein
MTQRERIAAEIKLVHDVPVAGVAPFTEAARPPKSERAPRPHPGRSRRRVAGGTRFLGQAACDPDGLRRPLNHRRFDRSVASPEVKKN